MNGLFSNCLANTANAKCVRLSFSKWKLKINQRLLRADPAELHRHSVLMDGAGETTLSSDACPPSCSSWTLVKAASLDTCRPTNWTQIALTRYHTVIFWLIWVKSALKSHIRYFPYICVTRCRLKPLLHRSEIQLKPANIRFLCAVGMCKLCFHTMDPAVDLGFYKLGSDLILT